MSKQPEATNTTEQQLLEAQQEIIRLQRELLTLKAPQPDDDVHWHLTSGGELAEAILAGDDLEKLQKLRDWVFSFGKKYIKPYVHPEAYAEVIAHMMRGIPERLAELETLAEIADQRSKTKQGKATKKPTTDEKHNAPSQKVLPLPPSDKDSSS